MLLCQLSECSKAFVGVPDLLALPSLEFYKPFFLGVGVSFVFLDEEDATRSSLTGPSANLPVLFLDAGVFSL